MMNTLPDLSEQTAMDAPEDPTLDRLGSVAANRGLGALAQELYSLSDFVQQDMSVVEDELRQLDRPQALVGRAGRHLLRLGGKRLRPLCVALAARCGKGFNTAAMDFGVAVELVHNATLLHDDVVDLARERRGQATARLEYGNAAAIFAGDWLLIEALRRVRRAALPGLLERLLDTIDEMILAESLPLEHRGRLDVDRSVYFRIAEGKTAALFRYALYSGGRAGQLTEPQCQALAEYGAHLGVAFQVVDDLLDLAGDAARTGKALFTDLKEGMVTYPLILIFEQDPALGRQIADWLAGSDDLQLPDEVLHRVRVAAEASGAEQRCRELAVERAHHAIGCLEALPQSRARSALEAVAHATAHRRR
ncbi:MAG: polyprenyl synthetase family protein [Acidobacteriota bacterium]